MTTTNRILTQEQAEHAYSAMKGALEMHGKVFIEHPDYSLTMLNNGLVVVNIKDTAKEDTWGDFRYSSPDAFADAYAVHYGLTSVQPESTIDRMVREAQENLKEYVEGYSDAVLAEVRQGFRDARAALHKRIGLSVTQLARQKVRSLITVFNEQHGTRFKSIDNTYN